MRFIKSLSALLVLLTIGLIAQQTPNQLRVLTDANNYLLVEASAQVNPISQPTIFSNTRLRTDADGNLLVILSSSSGIAPADATYITQTPNATLTAEQALSTLSSGILRVATTTGVITSLTDSAGILANISDETGTGVLTFATAPTFTTSITTIRDNLITTSTDGIILRNTTASTVGVPVQISPRFKIGGTAWDINSVVSDTIDFILEVLPESANTTTGTLKFGFSRNGGAPTYPLIFFSDGSFTSLGSATFVTLTASNSGYINFSGRSGIRSDADGLLRLSNDGQTSFTRLILGTNDTTVNGLGLTKDTGGHLVLRRGDGSTGTVTVANIGANSCGTTAATIVGTDNAGKVTVGAVSGTQCRVTFVSTWASAPACVVTNETTANLLRATSTTTTVDFSGTLVGADILSYSCVGY